MNKIPLALSIADAARSLGIGRTLAFRLIAEGHLRAIKVAGRTLVPIATIREFLESAPPARRDDGGHR